MSMIYNAKRGWIETTPFILKENTTESGFDNSARVKFEAEQTIKLIEQQLQNAIGYKNYLKNKYNQNPDDMGAIKDLKKFYQYLTKSIGLGPGTIGEWGYLSEK